MLCTRLCLAATLAALTSFLSTGCGGGDNAPNEQPGMDAAPPPPARDAGRDATVVPGFDAGVDAPATDMDAGIDAAPPPPVDAGVDAPIVPGSPSRALAAGATISTSRNFKAIRTLGESPGGNNTEKSSKYVFHGGLVGSTQ
jgi:hypothetical protein